MRQRPIQIAQYARDMTEILRLAIAPVEARKNAQNLGGALRRERRIKPCEAGRIEALIVQPSAYVAAEQRDLERLRHIIADSLKIDPRVLADPSLSVDLKGVYQAQGG